MLPDYSSCWFAFELEHKRPVLVPEVRGEVVQRHFPVLAVFQQQILNRKKYILQSDFRILDQLRNVDHNVDILFSYFISLILN